MNGIHDLGGMEGFGPILAEMNEPVFHEEWEGSVFATVIACMAQGIFNIDEFRHAVERIGNARYVQSSYYERWLAGLDLILREKSVLEAGEVNARVSELLSADTMPPRPAPIGDTQLAPALSEGIKAGMPTERETRTAPRFQPGDVVRTRNMNPAGHVRLPAYARNKVCRIHQYHGAHVLPDANGHGLGEQAEPLYTVCFESAELWGEDTDRVRGTQYLEVWESYLTEQQAIDLEENSER